MQKYSLFTKTHTSNINKNSKNINLKEKISIKSPEVYLNQIISFFSKTENKLAFLTTFIFGLIIHFQLYSQELTNPDGLWNSVYYKAGIWEATLGRWGIRIIDSIRLGLVSPIVSTIVSILIISFASIFLVKVLKIKSKLSIILTSISIVAMPALVDLLTYWYCSDSYALSILLSILAIYLTFDGPFKRKQINILFASMFLCFSMSLYQAQIGVAITLCVFRIIIEILENNKTTKEIIKQLVYCILMGIIGITTYYIATQILLKFLNTPLASYGWSNTIGFENLWSSIQNAYTTFINYYFKDNIVHNLKWKRQYLYLVLGLLTVISILTIIFKNKIYKKKTNFITLLLAIIGLPIWLGAISIIAPSNSIIIRTSVQYILPIILSISLIDLINIDNKSWLKENFINMLKVLICVVTMLINFTYVLSNNATYMAIKRTHDQAYSYVIRVMDRIETNENYQKGMPIMFAGIIDKMNYPMDYKIYIMANGGVSDFPAFWNTYLGSTSTWKNFLNNYLGMSINLCTSDEYKKIILTQEFKDMKTFPDRNSVKVINGVMVVKFSNNPPIK